MGFMSALNRKTCMRYDVFISYKRRGSLSLAEKIYTHLDREGINVYLDLKRDDSKVAFSEYLLRVIEQSKVIICVLGRETLTSEWVHREIRHGYKHKIPMIPIFQESFSTPRRRQEDYIEYLLSYDGVKVFDETGWYYQKALEDITEKVKNFVSTPPFTQAPVEYPVVFDASPAPIALTVEAETLSTLSDKFPSEESDSKPKRRLTVSVIIAVFVFGIAGIAGIAAIRGMVENPQTAETETAVALLAESSSTPTPTPTPTYTPSETPTTPPTPQPTNTPHPTVTPTYTDTPSPTVTPTFTPTASGTPTNTPPATFTDAPTPTLTFTPRPTLTFTPTPTLTPSVQVIVSPPTEPPIFLVDSSETTNKQYRGCVQAQKCSPPSNQRRLYDLSFDDKPVVYVSWRMANDYCIYSGGRLPTEDEWITASRHNRSLGERVSEWVGSHNENPEIAVTRGNGRDTPERMELNPQITSDVIGFRCGRYSSP